MAHIIADRVKESTTSTGTSSITLTGADTGYRTFDSQLTTSDTCFYCIDGSAEWEVGLGTYSGTNTLTRTSVLTSSNANSAVSFSAGTKDVFITNPASQIPYIQSGTFTPTIIGTSTAGVGTYTAQIGTYYKIGSVCFVSIGIAITAHTGTGSMRITGLPFSAGAGQIIPVRVESLTFTGQLYGRLYGASSFIDLETMASGASPTLVAMDTTATCVVTGWYLVA